MATWQVPFLNLKIKMHTPHQCSTGGTLFEDDYHQLYSPVICAGGARCKDSTVQQNLCRLSRALQTTVLCLFKFLIGPEFKRYSVQADTVWMPKLSFVKTLGFFVWLLVKQLGGGTWEGVCAACTGICFYSFFRSLWTVICVHFFLLLIWW